MGTLGQGSGQCRQRVGSSDEERQSVRAGPLAQGSGLCERMGRPGTAGQRRSGEALSEGGEFTKNSVWETRLVKRSPR